MIEVYRWNDLPDVTKRYIIEQLDLHKAGKYMDIGYTHRAYDLWDDFLAFIRIDVIEENLAPQFMDKYSTNLFELTNFTEVGDYMDQDYMEIIPHFGTFGSCS